MKNLLLEKYKEEKLKSLLIETYNSYLLEKVDDNGDDDGDDGTYDGELDTDTKSHVSDENDDKEEGKDIARNSKVAKKQNQETGEWEWLDVTPADKAVHKAYDKWKEEKDKLDSLLKQKASSAKWTKRAASGTGKTLTEERDDAKTAVAAAKDEKLKAIDKKIEELQKTPEGGGAPGAPAGEGGEPKAPAEVKLDKKFLDNFKESPNLKAAKKAVSDNKEEQNKQSELIQSIEQTLDKPEKNLVKKENGESYTTEELEAKLAQAKKDLTKAINDEDMLTVKLNTETQTQTNQKQKLQNHLNNLNAATATVPAGLKGLRREQLNRMDLKMEEMRGEEPPKSEDEILAAMKTIEEENIKVIVAKMETEEYKGSLNAPSNPLTEFTEKQKKKDAAVKEKLKDITATIDEMGKATPKVDPEIINAYKQKLTEIENELNSKESQEGLDEIDVKTLFDDFSRLNVPEIKKQIEARKEERKELIAGLTSEDPEVKLAAIQRQSERDTAQRERMKAVGEVEKIKAQYLSGATGKVKNKREDQVAEIAQYYLDNPKDSENFSAGLEALKLKHDNEIVEIRKEEEAEAAAAQKIKDINTGVVVVSPEEKERARIEGIKTNLKKNITPVTNDLYNNLTKNIHPLVKSEFISGDEGFEGKFNKKLNDILTAEASKSEGEDKLDNSKIKEMMKEWSDNEMTKIIAVSNTKKEEEEAAAEASKPKAKTPTEEAKERDKASYLDRSKNDLLKADPLLYSYKERQLDELDAVYDDETLSDTEKREKIAKLKEAHAIADAEEKKEIERQAEVTKQTVAIIGTKTEVALTPEDKTKLAELEAENNKIITAKKQREQRKNRTNDALTALTKGKFNDIAKEGERLHQDMLDSNAELMKGYADKTKEERKEIDKKIEEAEEALADKLELSVKTAGANAEEAAKITAKDKEDKEAIAALAGSAKALADEYKNDSKFNKKYSMFTGRRIEQALELEAIGKQLYKKVEDGVDEEGNPIFKEVKLEAKEREQLIKDKKAEHEKIIVAAILGKDVSDDINQTLEDLLKPDDEKALTSEEIEKNKKNIEILTSNKEILSNQETLINSKVGERESKLAKLNKINPTLEIEMRGARTKMLEKTNKLRGDLSNLDKTSEDYAEKFKEINDQITQEEENFDKELSDKADDVINKQTAADKFSKDKKALEDNDKGFLKTLSLTQQALRRKQYEKMSSIQNDETLGDDEKKNRLAELEIENKKELNKEGIKQVQKNKEQAAFQKRLDDGNFSKEQYDKMSEHEDAKAEASKKIKDIENNKDLSEDERAAQVKAAEKNLSDLLDKQKQEIIDLDPENKLKAATNSAENKLKEAQSAIAELENKTDLTEEESAKLEKLKEDEKEQAKEVEKLKSNAEKIEKLKVDIEKIEKSFNDKKDNIVLQIQSQKELTSLLIQDKNLSDNPYLKRLMDSERNLAKKEFLQKLNGIPLSSKVKYEVQKKIKAIDGNIKATNDALKDQIDKGKKETTPEIEKGITKLAKQKDVFDNNNDLSEEKKLEKIEKYKKQIEKGNEIMDELNKIINDESITDLDKKDIAKQRKSKLEEMIATQKEQKRKLEDSMSAEF